MLEKEIFLTKKRGDHLMEDAQHKSMKVLFYECLHAWKVIGISLRYLVKWPAVLLPHEKIIP